MVSCLIQLEEKRCTRREGEFRESFWILFTEKYLFPIFFLSPPFIPLCFNTRGCIVEKVV